MIIFIYLNKRGRNNMSQNKNSNQPLSGKFTKMWKQIKHIWKTDVNVYFISGMCYNCSVFDKLTLPEGFNKKYIEWHTPHVGESLEEYTRTMAQTIDTSRPFVLVGYSFGAVIMQEMNTFLNPLKSVIISSFKSKEEIPMLFKALKHTNFVDMVPDQIYSDTQFVTETFNRLVYHMPNAELAQYMTVTDAGYIKWAAKQITEWIPAADTKHLYHIHGTNDQIFPYDLVRNAFPVEGGDHLMVFKKADVISLILSGILLIKEE